jgi:hypothetical protein
MALGGGGMAAAEQGQMLWLQLLGLRPQTTVSPAPMGAVEGGSFIVAPSHTLHLTTPGQG